MKTDTEYFHLALAAWNKANRAASFCPMTGQQLSEVLTAAQKLKQADIDAHAAT